jgi:peptidoglycan lytic transglycosylase
VLEGPRLANDDRPVNGRPWIGVIVLASIASGCASAPHPAPPRPPAGTRAPADDGPASGLASYYGEDFHGRTTASGVRFDMNAMVAAHPTYPFGTIVRVTNLQNGRSVRVRIVDRGPATRPQTSAVIIDLSRRAAHALGLIRAGHTRVRLDVERWGR